MDVYDEVWERFVRERRLEFGGHTDPQWREEHALSASLVIPVQGSRFRERLEPLRTRCDLSRSSRCTPTSCTSRCSSRASSRKNQNERTRSHGCGWRRSRRARGANLSDFPAFTVRLANLSAFPGVAFVEVHEGEMLDSLRWALCEACGLEKPSGPPHLTLAYFHAPDGTAGPRGAHPRHSALPGLAHRRACSRVRRYNSPGPPHRIPRTQGSCEDKPQVSASLRSACQRCLQAACQHALFEGLSARSGLRPSLVSISTDVQVLVVGEQLPETQGRDSLPTAQEHRHGVAEDLARTKTR